MSIAHAARPFRRLLDYVPDDVILEAAGREFDMSDGNKCVVGWVLRGVMARLVNKTAERINLDFETVTLDGYGYPYDRVSESEMLATLVGGRRDTWEKMFNGVTHDATAVRWDGMPYKVNLPIIEYAFVRRLADAVERTHGR